MKSGLIILFAIGLFVFIMVTFSEEKTTEKQKLQDELFVNQRKYDSLYIDSFYVLCDNFKIKFVSSVDEIQKIVEDKIPAQSHEDSLRGYSEFKIRYKLWELNFVRIDSILALKNLSRENYRTVCGSSGSLFEKYTTLADYKENFPLSALHVDKYATMSGYSDLMYIPILNKNPNGIFSSMVIKFNVQDELSDVEYFTWIEEK